MRHSTSERTCDIHHKPRYTCNSSGLVNADFAGKWGMVGVDWSNDKRSWTKAKPMNCSASLLAQAEAIKAVNPATKVMVYRNLAKALPWFEGVSAKLQDPAHNGFFMDFKDYRGPQSNGSYHVPACTAENGTVKCSRHYHDQDQTPRGSTKLGGDNTCDEECDCGNRVPQGRKHHC